MQLTDAGRALLHHARMMQQQMQTMRDELGQYAHGLKGHIRLLSNTAAISAFLPNALAAFLAQNPNLDIDLEEKPSHDIVQALVDGVADIDIVADSVDTGSLQTTPCQRDNLVVVLPSKHALSRKKSLRFEDILNENFVGLSRGSALQKHLAGHAAQIGKRVQ